MPASLPAAGAPDVEAVLAGDQAHAWLLAGATVGTDGSRRVAFWSAPAAGGAWQPAATSTVSGDGPEDTISGLARMGPTSVAFGSRPSPIHGIPRPSPWVAGPAAGPWQEVPVLRELFGGENVVGLGGLAGGPHGFTIAGTWVNPSNRAVATVWRSPDGRHWQRNDTDPALGGTRGEYTSAVAVADAASGLAVVGSALAPTPADPAAQRGALWQSTDGTTWARVGAGDPSLQGHATQVRADHVVAFDGGWVAVGARTTPTSAAVVIWWWGRGSQLVSTAVTVPGPVTATALAVAGDELLVGALAGGHPRLWAATVRGAGAPHLRAISTPPHAGTAARAALLLAADGGRALLVIGPRVWWGALP